ncbi:KPN_02809 family neutral zinc metallopeptidase [Prevotella melaninogenica]|jgi:putative neutral zinc metallopeptidase|uniref:KPN_02809 family neutral zinc metallopeptidase n=1 Tax=Prevotella melaninogenica TaxID=28132 RepID=UPI0024315222|nr:neutral zinc metallopeptidase [Prevotella melaninogenica]
MRLTGRRESNNVEDRRGMGTGAKAGIGGIGGIIVIALITFLSGGNMGDVVNNIVQQQMQGQTEVQTGGEQHQFTEEEEKLADFSKQILAGTEDVWTEQFQLHGMRYQYPTLVLFTGAVQTACGNGSAAMGPFYCSADQRLYLDLSFFSSMRKDLGIQAKGDLDFAYAYVIAHEVGHHVEYLRGILGKCHAKMACVSKEEANKLSVKLELLADYYAGCWAHYDNEKYQSLTDGDIEEAIDCAEKIGDNYLQKKARGYALPETFTHGTSEQRMYWLKKGIETGDWNTTTFAPGDLD